MIHRLFPSLPPGPAWTAVKIWIGHTFGFADDTSHMGSGLLILTLAALVLRRPPWTLWPWCAVLVAETVNEAYDLTHGSDEGNWPDSWHDFWITLLWPTVILVVYRRWAPPRSGDRRQQPLEQPAPVDPAVR